MEVNKILFLLFFSFILEASAQCRDQCSGLQKEIKSLNDELGKIRESNDANLKKIISDEDISRFIGLRDSAEKQGRVSPKAEDEMNSILSKYYKRNPKAEAWQYMSESSIRVREIEKEFDSMLSNPRLVDKNCVLCTQSPTARISITISIRFKCCPPAISVEIELEW